MEANKIEPISRAQKNEDYTTEVYESPLANRMCLKLSF